MLQSGCVTCVWELYTEQLAAYNKALEEVGSQAGRQQNAVHFTSRAGMAWPAMAVVGACAS